MSNSDKEKGLEYLNWKLGSIGVIRATQLSSQNEGVFFKTFLEQKICDELEPSEWWGSAVKGGVEDGFLRFVKTLYTFPSGTAGIERSFSTLGNILTKQRNRMSVEKGAKLCLIHNYYKTKVANQD